MGALGGGFVLGNSVRQQCFETFLQTNSPMGEAMRNRARELDPQLFAKLPPELKSSDRNRATEKSGEFRRLDIDFDNSRNKNVVEDFRKKKRSSAEEEKPWSRRREEEEVDEEQAEFQDDENDEQSRDRLQDFRRRPDDFRKPSRAGWGREEETNTKFESRSRKFYDEEQEEEANRRMNKRSY